MKDLLIEIGESLEGGFAVLSELGHRGLTLFVRSALCEFVLSSHESHPRRRVRGIGHEDFGGVPSPIQAHSLIRPGRSEKHQDFMHNRLVDRSLHFLDGVLGGGGAPLCVSEFQPNWRPSIATRGSGGKANSIIAVRRDGPGEIWLRAIARLIELLRIVIWLGPALA